LVVCVGPIYIYISASGRTGEQWRGDHPEDIQTQGIAVCNGTTTITTTTNRALSARLDETS